MGYKKSWCLLVPLPNLLLKHKNSTGSYKLNMECELLISRLIQTSDFRLSAVRQQLNNRVQGTGGALKWTTEKNGSNWLASVFC
jgi:hypothetical protein